MGTDGTVSWKAYDQTAEMVNRGGFWQGTVPRAEVVGHTHR